MQHRRGLRRLDPRQQLALFGTFIAILMGSFALPLVLGLMAGGVIRLVGMPGGNPSIPILVVINLFDVAVLGGAVVGVIYGVRRRRRDGPAAGAGRGASTR